MHALDTLAYSVQTRQLFFSAGVWHPIDCDAGNGLAYLFFQRWVPASSLQQGGPPRATLAATASDAAPIGNSPGCRQMVNSLPSIRRLFRLSVYQAPKLRLRPGLFVRFSVSSLLSCLTGRLSASHAAFTCTLHPVPGICQRCRALSAMLSTMLDPCPRSGKRKEEEGKKGPKTLKHAP